MDPQNNGQDGAIGASEKIVINGEEFDPQEAQTLVGLGKKTREYEQKWSTSLDKVWPEYGRLTQERNQWTTEKQKLEEQLKTFEQKRTQGTETLDDTEKAREAARKLNILFKDDLDKEGYIKKSDLEKYLDERETTRKETERILHQVDEVVKEASETDGKPRVKKDVLLAFMNTYNIPDAKKAYEKMYEDELKAWQDAQVKSKKNPPLKTFKENGSQKTPVETKVTDSNFRDALREKLWGDNN